MKNMIMNPYWQPGPTRGPKYFSRSGPITYDDFSLHGYRTCSLSMHAVDDIKAHDAYDPSIIVEGEGMLYWGYRIRVIDAHSIILAVDYDDASGMLMQSDRFPITHLVDHQFKKIMGRFAIPMIAQTARLSLHFSGKITACTYCEPTAYFK